MKKFFLFAISIFVLTFLFVLFFQYILHIGSKKGALQVTSSPESKVYMNGKYIGTTPLCLCESADMPRVGDYTLKLIPTKTGLAEFQEKITISENVLTVVDRKFAKDSFSEGYYISLSPLSDKEKSELVVVSLPQGAKVLLDNTEIGTTPLSFKDPTESDHVLKVQRAGYKEKSIRIRTPLGYKLTVAAYLSTIDSLFTDSLETASPSGTLSVTPSPSLSASENTVTILDTPTGFLRVRDTIDGVEIGRVEPGESYPYTDEESGWTKITLEQGKSGWVSSQYIKKNSGGSNIPE